MRERALALRDLIAISRTRYMSLFDVSPIGYVLMGRDGSIASMNLTLAQMLGQHRDYMEGHSFALTVVSEERQRFEAHMAAAAAAAAATSEPVACDLNLLGSGEKGLLPVHMLTRRLAGGNGAPLLFLAAVVDQRARSETIATLQESGHQMRVAARELEARTNEAEKANVTLRGMAREVNKAEQRERQRIARLLHDDLQQLLVSAKMRLTIGRSDAARGVQIEEVGHLIDAAINSSRSLTAQISPPLLHDAGLDAGLRWLARFIEEHHRLRVELDLRLGVAPIDFSDRDFLFQAARELVFNVVKHAGVKKARLRIAVLGRKVRLEVEDRGAGFNGHLLERPTDSAEQMGLRTLRERVRLLGGTFAVQSRPGKGTKIELVMPLSEVHESPPRRLPQAAARPVVPQKGSNLVRVLLVDDHRVVREGIQSFLSQEDWLEIVGQAADGRQAVLMTRELQPDVVIMDISMPEMNGIEATRIITGENPRVRIIGMSMHQQQDMAEAMLAAGAERYLTKGGPAEDLIQAVRELGAPSRSEPEPETDGPGGETAASDTRKHLREFPA